MLSSQFIFFGHPIIEQIFFGNLQLGKCEGHVFISFGDGKGKSRQESNPSQKPPVVFDYPMPAANDATGKTDTPQRSGQ